MTCNKSKTIPRLTKVAKAHHTTEMSLPLLKMKVWLRARNRVTFRDEVSDSRLNQAISGGLYLVMGVVCSR